MKRKSTTLSVGYRLSQPKLGMRKRNPPSDWYTAFTEDGSRWFIGPISKDDAHDRAAYLTTLGKSKVSWGQTKPKGGTHLPHVSTIVHVHDHLRKGGWPVPSTSGGYSHLSSYKPVKKKRNPVVRSKRNPDPKGWYHVAPPGNPHESFRRHYSNLAVGEVVREWNALNSKWMWRVTVMPWRGTVVNAGDYKSQKFAKGVADDIAKKLVDQPGSTPKGNPRKRNPEPVSILATYGKGDAGKHPVLDQALDIAERVKLLPVSYVGSRISQLGGPHRASVSVAVSLDPKASWQNGIFENSRHAKFMIDVEDGTIKQLTGWKVPKFRLARFKTPAEAVAKIAKWAREGALALVKNPRSVKVPSKKALEARHKKLLDANKFKEADKVFDAYVHHIGAYAPKRGKRKA